MPASTLSPHTPLSLVFEQYRQARLPRASRFTIRGYRASLTRLEKFLDRTPLVGDLIRENIDATLQHMQTCGLHSLAQEFTSRNLHAIRRFLEAMRSSVQPSVQTSHVDADVCSLAGGSQSFTFCVEVAP